MLSEVERVKFGLDRSFIMYKICTEKEITKPFNSLHLVDSFRSIIILQFNKMEWNFR